MTAMMLVSLFMLAYIYGGYRLWLKCMAALWRQYDACEASEAHSFPSVTVLVTVYNEADRIKTRIENILQCRYPESNLEILVASDGSTDATDDSVTMMDDPRVRLFRPEQRRGKTDTQNQAIRQATGDIIVFTDADTRFDNDFLVEVVAPFANLSVGGVDGHLLFITDQSSGISQSQGFYWKQELDIRKLESQLGILAVASGACMAIRRSLFRPIQATVGEDCVAPLDVVMQGYRMVHADKAIAFDEMEHETVKEFRTRTRMTLRNWQGTWNYPQLLNPFIHPGIAFSLWSHKILRWLSPFFLIIITVGAFPLAINSDHRSAIALLIGAFYLAGLLGWMSELRGWRIPLVRTVFSFLVANTGFFIGVITAVFSNKRITSYR